MDIETAMSEFVEAEQLLKAKAELQAKIIEDLEAAMHYGLVRIDFAAARRFIRGEKRRHDFD